ncbi:MAG: nucleotide exchange factor GrpE [Deltaproteobacteria bacterium]|nr:nucleotide exchange factor GrpE [Deltaproteobacteria bacterium]
MMQEEKDETEAAVEGEATADQTDAGAAADDAAPEPSEVERLTEELAAAREEARRLEDQFLRQAAETENYKKRVAREKQDAIRYANESLVRDLLPVIDDLERAMEHGLTDDNGQSLLDGVALVHRSCLEALQKHGVIQVTAKGESFDPEKHEAFAQVETAEHAANTVVDEAHRGYYLNDRLLRPSLVSVAKTPAKQAENTVENDPADD